MDRSSSSSRIAVSRCPCPTVANLTGKLNLGTAVVRTTSKAETNEHADSLSLAREQSCGAYFDDKSRTLQQVGWVHGGEQVIVISSRCFAGRALPYELGSGCSNKLAMYLNAFGDESQGPRLPGYPSARIMAK